MKRGRVWTSIEWKQVGFRQQWHCAVCSTAVDETAELDHRTPLSSGGSNDLTNAQLLCPTCHKRKSHEEEQARIEKCRDVLRERACGKREKPRQSATLGLALENVFKSELVPGQLNFSEFIFVGSLVRHRRLHATHT